MYTLEAAPRNQELKVKQLRQNGFIPGSLYGKDIKGSMLLQINRSDVNSLLKHKAKGSRITLSINGEKIDTILREVCYDPANRQVEHLGLQKLSENDLVTTTAQVVLRNKEKIPVSNIHQVLFEIPHRAITSKLVEKIEIDLNGMNAGACVKVQDLDISKDADIEVLIAPENLVISIIEAKGRLNSFIA
jgi:large subunit ribosomal protein L25